MLAGVIRACTAPLAAHDLVRRPAYFVKNQRRPQPTFAWVTHSLRDMNRSHVTGSDGWLACIRAPGLHSVQERSEQ